MMFYTLHEYVTCDWCVTLSHANVTACNFFFYLNQQFITWYAMVDCGSYFVTTYKRSRLTWGLKQEREKEKKKKYKGQIKKRKENKKEKEIKN